MRRRLKFKGHRWRISISKKRENKMATNITATTKAIIDQIDKFPTLDDWWTACILTPEIKVFLPQLFALLLLESAIFYIHDWLAAILCFMIIISKIYNFIASLAIKLTQGYLLLQIRDSYNKGIKDSESLQNKI